jgi:hypothetical protein
VWWVWHGGSPATAEGARRRRQRLRGLRAETASVASQVVLAVGVAVLSAPVTAGAGSDGGDCCQAQSALAVLGHGGLVVGSGVCCVRVTDAEV